MANPLQGEFPFPKAGEGMCFKFTLADLAEMAARYTQPGQTAKEAEDSFWGTVIRGIFQKDPVVILDCLRYGLKKEGAPTKRMPQSFIEDPPFSPEEAIKPILNALFMRRDGKSYEEQVEERTNELLAEAEAAAMREREGLPPPQPVSTEIESPGSTDSSAPDTAQV